MKVKKFHSQGHTLRFDKSFYQKIKYSLLDFDQPKKLFFYVSTIFNNYLKNFLSQCALRAKMHNKNISQRKFLVFLSSAPPVVAIKIHILAYTRTYSKHSKCFSSTLSGTSSFSGQSSWTPFHGPKNSLYSFGILYIK